MTTPDLLERLRPGDPVTVVAWRDRRVPATDPSGRAVFLGWQKVEGFARVRSRPRSQSGVEFPFVHRDYLELA